MNVPTVLIGDVCEQIRGVTYQKGDATRQPGDGMIPVLRAGNIGDGALSFEDLVHVPDAKVAQKQRIRRGDVVIATSSGSLEVVGKAAQATVDYPGGFGAFCKVLRPDAGVHDRYFGHFFRTQAYRRKISTLAAGANINNLRNEHLNNLELRLPSMAEQHRIAAVLDHVDTLRVKRHEAISLLGNLAQSIFLDMFGDPIANPHGHELQPLAAWVDPARPISYGILKPGDNVEDGEKYIRVVDMKDRGIDQSRIKKTSREISEQYLRSKLKGGDILLSIRGHVGRLAEVPDELAGANITQDTARIAVPVESVAYVLECLRSNSIQQWMGRFVKGAAVRGINLADVKKIPIPLVDSNAQLEFARRTEALDTVMDAHTTQLATLDELFISLQQRAFSGRLWDHEAA